MKVGRLSGAVYRRGGAPSGASLERACPLSAMSVRTTTPASADPRPAMKCRGNQQVIGLSADRGRRETPHLQVIKEPVGE
jgi:hypothetical protein